ncbi:tryptophan-rich sensory protein [Candidatus Micrarchaeota archaeon]|nr:tryptophan-rich sensory protein [Candidatus Micrarchaeota archaeon]MBU1166663.1 tryptophan-rich sensory protein [Candidatus Micrarchaeota archaeon]MBU1886620.1 tryptophan-rich sensory protein [Candidatus Micrarchaeota archaeon]
MKLKNILYLIGFIILCELAGLIGSFFTIQSVQGWYLTLIKPEFNPPSWIFAPVWTTLYALMGISAYLVFTSGKKESKSALLIFGGQLILNTLWSIIFFGLQSPFLAFLTIIVLWAMIVWTIYAFYHISKKSAVLLIPYILWVSFAAVLNYFIMVLN